jgi:hypothetical protein
LEPLGVVVGADRFPPAAAGHIAGKLLNRHSPGEIAAAIEVLVDLLDLMGGDPDAEDNGDAEAVGDEADIAWLEWTGRKRRTVDTDGPFAMGLPTEDDEDDDPDTGVEDGTFDPEEDCCEAGDDGCGPIIRHGSSSYGSADDAGIELPVPRYGIDQSLGPIQPA